MITTNRPIAVYAGTFDPPTKGHTNIMTELVNKGYEVWMVPITSPPPHKPNSNDITIRLTMCHLAIHDLPVRQDIKLLDIAINFQDGMSAYKLMYLLTRDNPDKYLSFVIGTDILQHISEWDCPDMRKTSDHQPWYENIDGEKYRSEGDAFINRFNFLVLQRLPRDKYPLVIPKSNSGVILTNFNIVALVNESDISSTITRTILSKNISDGRLTSLISSGVLSYIKTHRLFNL